MRMLRRERCRAYIYPLPPSFSWGPLRRVGGKSCLRVGPFGGFCGGKQWLTRVIRMPERESVDSDSDFGQWLAGQDVRASAMISGCSLALYEANFVLVV